MLSVEKRLHTVRQDIIDAVILNRRTWFYLDERYCKHCDKDTDQRCHDTTHERDATEDYQECLECGWYQTGWSNKWHPPEEE